MKQFKHALGAAALAALTLTLTLAGQTASAHSGHSHDAIQAHEKSEAKPTPSATVVPFCDGKYDDIAKEFNRKNLIGTVNFYRINSGLSKLKSEKLHSAGRGGYGYYTNARTRRADALMLLDKAQTHLSTDAQRDYLIVLGRLISSGSGVEADFRFEDFNDGKNRVECNITGVRQLSRWQRMKDSGFCNWHQTAVNDLRSNTAFDWLVSRQQIVGASNQWTYSGVKHGDKTKAVLDHIDAQALKRPGVNIWMALYGQHKVLEHEVPAEITARAQNAVTDVLTCKASAKDYAIVAAGDLGLPRQYLPKALSEQRVRRDIHELTYTAMTEGGGLNTTYHAALESLRDELLNKHWANGFMLLSAPDYNLATELGEIEPLYIPEYGVSNRHKNILFGLPARHMPEQYPMLKMAHALSEKQYVIGLEAIPNVIGNILSDLEVQLNTAQNRLKRYEKIDRYEVYAEQQKSLIEGLTKDQEKFSNLNLEASGLTDEMKLTLYTILTGASHNIDTHHRGLYWGQSDETFLDIYLRRILFPGTRQHRSYHYRTARPFSKELLERAKKQDHLAFNMNPLRKNDGTPELGYAALVDWEKLARIGGEEPLLDRLALNTFAWLDTATPDERARHTDVFAPALYRLIRDARHEETKDYKGKPIQQQAFERLHKYYGNTDSAKTTRYWWPSRPAHGSHDL